MSNEDDGTDDPKPLTKVVPLPSPAAHSGGLFSNLFRRARSRNRKQTIDVETAEGRAYIENLRVRQELAREAVKTTLEIEGAHNDTPLLIEEHKRAFAHDMDERERKRSIEAQRTKNELASLQAQNTRNLDAHAPVAEKEKVERQTELEEAQAKLSHAKAARAGAENNAALWATLEAQYLAAGDFEKLRKLKQARQDERNQQEVTEKSFDLTAELEHLQDKRKQAMANNEPDSVISYLSYQISQLEDAIQIAKAGHTLP